MKQKGSYTIEAAVWVPLMIMVLVLALKIGMSLYQEIGNQDIQQKLQRLDVVQEFYNYQVMEEILEEATDD